MTWQKPAADLVARFQTSLPGDPRIERRSMFGCPCAFTGGNMFAGVHEQSLILRLPPGRREVLLAQGAAQPFVVMGRSMREYVAVPAAASRDQATLRAWLAEAFGHAAAMPPKAAKPRPAKVSPRKAATR
jgi:TfoX/Sxy family transcriptional regulator of competence genes